MTKSALILGANGRFGRNAAEAFKAAGWTTRLFDRKSDDLKTAAQGMDVIVNGWNPVYTDWAADIPKFTAEIIATAKETGATVMLPGNVYNFGAGSPDVLSEKTPHAAKNPLGRIRIEMEAAYRKSGVRTIILRGGDFIDTKDSGNWFDMIMTKNIDKGRFTYPGNATIPHAWAYLPDMARALVALAEKRDDLATFEDIPFPGYTLSGQEMCAALELVANRPMRLKTMSYLPLRLLSPFWKMGAKLVEMSYLWSMPHRLDNRKFDALLPDFRPSPIGEALSAAIKHKIDVDQPVMATNTAALAN